MVLKKQFKKTCCYIKSKTYFFVKKITPRSLTRKTPVNSNMAPKHGTPIDRYYIEHFLKQHKNCIHGQVLEIAENTYTKRFGGSNVTKSNILHVSPQAPHATIIADLTQADHIPSNQFDCIIFTQTLQFIYNAKAAIKTLHRILKPGGIILATVPGISHISRFDMDQWGEYWRFTTMSAQKLFAESFENHNISVQYYGNVFSTVAFLHGLAVQEIKRKNLDLCSPNYQLIITIKAQKDIIK